MQTNSRSNQSTPKLSEGQPFSHKIREVFTSLTCYAAHRRLCLCTHIIFCHIHMLDRACQSVFIQEYASAAYNALSPAALSL